MIAAFFSRVQQSERTQTLSVIITIIVIRITLLNILRSLPCLFTKLTKRHAVTFYCHRRTISFFLLKTIREKLKYHSSKHVERIKAATHYSASFSDNYIPHFTVLQTCRGRLMCYHYKLREE